jgi:predicted outer membrane repeat protein
MLKPLAILFVVIGLSAPEASFAQLDCPGSWIPLAGKEEPCGVGFSAPVSAIVRFDFGEGPQTVVGGYFTKVGGQSALRIASGDGTVWSQVGDGFDAGVRLLCVLESSGGEPATLFAAGEFSASGSVAVSRLATWNGSGWGPVGPGLGAATTGLTEVSAICAGAVGIGGAKLFVAGNFTIPGVSEDVCIAAWDGTAWSVVASESDGSVYSLAIHTSAANPGPVLVAGGDFGALGGTAAARIAQWDGLGWKALGVGLSDGSVSCLASYPAAGDSELFVGGSFTGAGDVTSPSLIRWSGDSWLATPFKVENPSSRPIALAPFDAAGSGGPSLLALSINGLLTWDGIQWRFVSTGFSSVPTCLCPVDEGDGDRSVYVGGNFFADWGFCVNPSPAGDSFLAKWKPCPRVLHVPTEYSSIQEAVDGSLAGDVIEIESGEYTEAVQIQGKRITVQGAGQPCDVTLKGSPNSTSRIVTVVGQAAAGTRLVGLRFQDSVSGAVLVSSSGVTLEACCFTENTAHSGGAILVDGNGSVSAQSCQFFDNHARGSGGAVFVSDASASLVNSEFIGNSATKGGAIAAELSHPNQDVVIQGSLLERNTASIGSGGAIDVSGPASDPLTLGATTVCDNSNPQLVPQTYVDLGGNTICACDADINADGIVDGQDLAILLAFWGPSGLFPAADIDASGVVDGADLAILLSGWGPCS